MISGVTLSASQYPCPVRYKPELTFLHLNTTCK